MEEQYRLYKHIRCHKVKKTIMGKSCPTYRIWTNAKDNLINCNDIGNGRRVGKPKSMWDNVVQKVARALLRVRNWRRRFWTKTNGSLISRDKGVWLYCIEAGKTVILLKNKQIIQQCKYDM